MTRAWNIGVLPWIGLILVLRLGWGPSSGSSEGPSAPREEHALEAPSALATLCATLGCGCPHEEVRSECCCAPGDAFSAEPRVSVTRAALLVASAGRADDDALPRASLTVFHCSGPKPTSSAAGASSSVAVPGMPVACAEPVVERDWCARIEPGPPFDLATEPATPPPRIDARG